MRRSSTAAASRAVECGRNPAIALASSVARAADRSGDPRLVALASPSSGRRQVLSLQTSWCITHLSTTVVLGRASNLRPVYFPFWTFDGTLEIKYRCEVSISENRWEQRTGEQFMNFDDVLVPGLRALSFKELDRILPFEMKSLVEFKDEQLAGWYALTYDHSLAAASLDARGRVMENANRKLAPRIEAAREKRNLQLIPSGWTGLTYKHLLLPLFVGNYHYKGVEYHLLVNGQIGKVGGVKPRDRIKLGMLLARAGLIALLLLFWLVWSNRGFLFGV